MWILNYRHMARNKCSKKTNEIIKITLPSKSSGSTKDNFLMLALDNISEILPTRILKMRSQNTSEIQAVNSKFAAFLLNLE